MNFSFVSGWITGGNFAQHVPMCAAVFACMLSTLPSMRSRSSQCLAAALAILTLPVFWPVAEPLLLAPFGARGWTLENGFNWLVGLGMMVILLIGTWRATTSIARWVHTGSARRGTPASVPSSESGDNP